MFPPTPNTSIEPSRPVEVAVAVVLRSSTQVGRPPFVLIGHRLSSVHLADLWEFPGGKREPGESGPACALRELEEETGVRANWRRLLAAASHEYPDRRIDIEFHLCAYRGGDPAPRATQAVRWSALDRLECYRFPEATRVLLPRIVGAAMGEPNLGAGAEEA